MDIPDLISNILFYLPFAHKYKYVSHDFLSGYRMIEEQYRKMFYRFGIYHEESHIINVAILTGDLDTIMQYTHNQNVDNFFRVMNMLHICGKNKLILYILKQKIHQKYHEKIQDMILYNTCMHITEYGIGYQIKDMNISLDKLIGILHPIQASMILQSEIFHDLRLEIQNFIHNLASTDHSIIPIKGVTVYYIQLLRKYPYLRRCDLDSMNSSKKKENRLRIARKQNIISPSILRMFQTLYDSHIESIDRYNPVIRFLYQYIE